MSSGCLIAAEGIEMDGYVTDFDAGAGNEKLEDGGDISAWLNIERLEHKHALRENNWQQQDF
jgi:hypothetical protein